MNLTKPGISGLFLMDMRNRFIQKRKRTDQPNSFKSQKRDHVKRLRKKEMEYWLFRNLSFTFAHFCH